MDLLTILEPWSRGRIAEAIQINDRLSEYGVSWADVEEWIKKNPSQHRKRMLSRDHDGKSCPKCGKRMSMSLVNSKSIKYSMGFRRYYLCGAACCDNMGCGYEEWG